MLRPLPPALLASLALALGACGDDETTTVTETETVTTTTTAEAETTDETTTEETTTDADFPEVPCPGAESPPNITAVISRGIDCAAVEDAIAELQSVSRKFRIGDFFCERVSGGRLGGSWECLGEAGFFTFEFGD